MEVEILFLFCHPEPVEGQNKKRLQRTAGKWIVKRY
jgi:hypothetical protein